VVGADWKIEAIVDPGAQPGSGMPAQPAQPAAPAREPEPSPPAPPTPEPSAAEPRGDSGIAAARGAIQQTRHGEDHRAAEQSRAADLAAADAEAHPDDQPIEEEQLGGAELLQRELGAQMIEEIRHQ
jgi:DNA polymerase-3 subunit gamma/tau